MQKPLVYLYTIKQLKIFFDLVKFVRFFLVHIYIRM